jgi:hypothetical protein
MGDPVLCNRQIGAPPDVAYQRPILAHFVAVEQAAEARRDKRLVAQVAIKIGVGSPEGKGRGTRNLGDNTEVDWDRALQKTMIESIKNLWSSEIADVVITY